MFTRFALLLCCLGLFAGDAAAAFALPSSLPAATEPEPAAVKSALAEFQSLSRKERRHRTTEARKAFKEFKAMKKAGLEPKASTLVQVIVAILLPPLGVYLHEGEINSRFWISLLLTLLFYVPGLIYALVVILGDD